jgi:hypothetical protein
MVTDMTVNKAQPITKAKAKGPPFFLQHARHHLDFSVKQGSIYYSLQGFCSKQYRVLFIILGHWSSKA